MATAISAPGTISVTIDDDVPLAVARSVTVGEGQTLSSDVVLIIDTSGSMGPVGTPGGSDPDGAGPYDLRLAMVKDAIEVLFASGAVHSVFLVDFNSTATFHNSGVSGGWYTDLNAALAAVDALSAGGTTDYDDALQSVTTNFTPPPAGGDRLVSVFMSDGQPTDDDGTGSNGIDEDDTNGNPAPGGEETDWINFLAIHNFDASYAIGFGGLSNTDKAFLEPIAWTGAGETADNPYDADNAAQAALDPNVVIISDSSSIDNLIDVLITLIGGSATGNVIDNLTPPDTTDDFSFGADGNGFVTSLHFDSDGDGVLEGTDSTYTFDGINIYLNNVLFDDNAHEVTFTTGFGGQMHFDFLSGGWDYRAPDPETVLATFVEHFTYTLMDSDNDQTPAAALDITVPPRPPSLTVASVTADEGGLVVFEINLSNAAFDDVVLSLAFANGTAEGSDYNSVNYEFSTDNSNWSAVVGNQITIPTGDTQVFVRVQTSEDADIDDETFTLTATATSGNTANVSDVGIATILDNDTPAADGHHLHRQFEHNGRE